MQNINKITSDFKLAMQKLYGDRLENVILYGSYARNEQTEDSDIDLLVVLKDEEISKFKEIKRITNIIYDYMMDNNIYLSYNPMTENYFKNGSSSFLHFVKKDAIYI